jgi:hypothetical protein
MEATAEDRAKRNHPVPAEMLLEGMKSVISEGKEVEFLAAFKGAFVLASEDDIKKLKSFLVHQGAANNPMNIAAIKIVGAARC